MSAYTPPSFNYPAGTTLDIDGRPHKPPVETMPGRIAMMDCQTGQPFLIPDGHGGTVLPTHDDFDRLLIEGRLEVRLPSTVTARQALAAGVHWDFSDLERIDPGIRKTDAEIRVLDDNGVRNGLKAVTAGLKEYWTQELIDQFGPHDPPATVKGWRVRMGKPGSRPIEGMVRTPGQGSRRPQDQDVPMEIRIKHALDCVQREGPMKTAWAVATDELVQVNEGLSPFYPKPEKPYPIFGYHSFRNDCIKLQGSDTEVVRRGRDMVESAMRGGGRPLTASRVLEKVIIDHTQLDAFSVVDPERDVVAGRPWLTLAIDVHSRAILAWVISFRPPSYWTVCECLRRMNLPKRPPPADSERYPILKRICGKPGELILDNAVEFVGHGLEDAARSAGFSVRFCPKKMPRYRAVGERAIGTIQRKMLENLPGATVPIAEKRRSGHDAQDLAVATPNELEALANKAIAEYHVEPHDGLNGLQPALVFQKSANRHGIDVIGDMSRWRLETYESKHNVQIRKSGARVFDGLRYHCAIGVKRLIDNNLRFEPRRQTRVDATIHTKIKYDPDNIAVIHAWDKTTRSYVELRCQDETYADGMPLWFHQELVEMARKEANAKAKVTATPRTKRRKATEGTPTEPTLTRIAEAEGEQAPEGFNTEAERLASRAKRIQAIRAIAPGARLRERNTLARLYDVPRIRQITGNIVWLDTDYAESATTDDFISHDVSALTALDQELQTDRGEEAPLPKQRTARNDRKDPRDAGTARSTKTTTHTGQEADNTAAATGTGTSRRRRARG